MDAKEFKKEVIDILYGRLNAMSSHVFGMEPALDDIVAFKKDFVREVIAEIEELPAE